MFIYLVISSACMTTLHWSRSNFVITRTECTRTSVFRGSVVCNTARHSWGMKQPTEKFCVLFLTARPITHRRKREESSKNNQNKILNIKKEKDRKNIPNYKKNNICSCGKLYALWLLGFWTLSIVHTTKNTKQHKVSETGSVSFLRWGGGIG
jgi:hypothetical protein